MVWIFSLAQRAPDPGMHLRYAALFFMTVHAALHYVSRLGLRLMADHRHEGAQEALRAYLDVRRISHLDQAVAWIGFLALAPHLI